MTTAAFIRVNDSKPDAVDYDQLKREADSRLFEFNAATARVRLLGGAECALAADRFYKHFEAEIVPKVSRDLRPDSDAYKELRSLAAASSKLPGAISASRTMLWAMLPAADRVPANATFANPELDVVAGALTTPVQLNQAVTPIACLAANTQVG
jgi:hypothetical protein